jgi:hypothetical protein
MPRLELVSGDRRHFIFSSPAFPLPSPFSAVPRSISLASPTHNTRSLGSDEPGRNFYSPIDADADVDNLPRSTRKLRDLATLSLQYLNSYRARSPLGRTRVRLPTSRNRSDGHRNISPNAPRTRFRIYNDSISATLQPQTPASLPESRHQSRYHPSFTAPARPRRHETPSRGSTRNSRHRGARSDSPDGMEEPGFRGLYAGLENDDDSILFQRANRRLWDLED